MIIQVHGPQCNGLDYGPYIPVNSLLLKALGAGRQLAELSLPVAAVGKELKELLASELHGLQLPLLVAVLFMSLLVLQ